MRTYARKGEKPFKACGHACASGFRSDRAHGVIHGPFRDQDTGRFMQDAEEASIEWDMCAYCYSTED